MDRGLLSGLVSYSTAGIALIGVHGSTIVQVLGFVLLVSRLIYEVPKAWRSLFRKDYDERG